MTDTLQQVVALVAKGEVRVSEHGYDEMAADGILLRDLVAGMAVAELVEEYPTFAKGPCRARAGARPRRQSGPRALGHPAWRERSGRTGHGLSSGSQALGRGQEEEIDMRTRHRAKLLHEGEYVAEVDVELVESDQGWSPYLTLEDAYKLDDVRDALRRGDVRTASRLARVYTLTPVPA